MPNEEKALVTREQEIATAATLYGAEKDVTSFTAAVQLVAPWAVGMKSQDVEFIVRRSLAMGVDPLNPHEDG